MRRTSCTATPAAWVRQEEYRPLPGRASRYDLDDWTTFDFVPRGLQAVGGRGIRIHLAAPPRGMWPAQLVERGDGKRVLAADSILFVADARPERMEDNRAALAWLFHIHAGGATRVLQVHKRDLAPRVPMATYHELAEHRAGRAFA